MATLKEVADLAGVSPITVSRVINQPDAVKEKTRARVEAAMGQLHYSPNLAAKSLATNRSGVVDVFIPEHIDISNPFVMHLIAGVSKTLSERYYSFLILRNRNSEHLCDGYIVTGLLTHEIEDFARYADERGRPVVLFGHDDLPGIDYIDVDNVLGAKRGTEHLIEQGHRRIAMINVQEDKDYTRDRLEGYRKALEENGIPYDPSLVIYTPNNVEGGSAAAVKLMAEKDVTGVFCASDTIGIGVSAELKKNGYSIPDDISLVGFDGLGHHMLASPHLTTVQQPIYEMGIMLAEALLERLDGRKGTIRKMVAPQLLPGGSTGPILH